MDNAIWGMLNDAEQELLRSVDAAKLAKLDEDDLATLHDRVRRARNKYSKLYRRRAGAEVKSAGARAKGHDRHARTVIKAEAFEEALGLVSQHLAKAAKASAAALKTERLALAKAAKGAGKGAPTPAKGKVASSGKKEARAKKPVEKRATASAKSTKKRKEAARASK